MKYIIVNSSSNYELRADMAAEFLRSQGHEVLMIASDFSHSGKCRRQVEKEGYRLVPTLPYYRNISVRRIISQLKFTVDAYRMIRGETADILYVMVPQNANVRLGIHYRKHHPGSRLIVDILDLWPESLPVRGSGRFPFSLWAGLRDRDLKSADTVILECSYYQKLLSARLPRERTFVMPWLKQDAAEAEPDPSRFPACPGAGAPVRLCYLGAVNNIIDIPEITRVIRRLASAFPVELEVMGLGEKKEQLLREAELAGAKVRDHGPVYDQKIKQAVMDRCHFGLNLMKETVRVGISMKSIDYLSAGLPILNNLPVDMEEIVSVHAAGVNIRREDTQLSELITAAADFRFDRTAIRRLYKERFSEQCVKDYRKILECRNIR